MIDANKIKCLSFQTLIDIYIGCYAEEFGLRRGAEIMDKINTSKTINKFINKLRSERLNPGEAGFITIVNSIPYFFLSSGETLGLASLLSIQKWTEICGNDVDPIDEVYLMDIAFQTVIRSQKTKVDSTFFIKYNKVLEDVFNLNYGPSEVIEGLFYHLDGDNNVEYIRFYDERTVISVSVTGLLNDFKWFHKDNLSLNRGTYTLQNSIITFGTIEAKEIGDGVVNYRGKIISEDEILFDIKSLINGFETKDKYKRYYGPTESAANVVIAKAPSFSLKGAMSSRV